MNRSPPDVVGELLKQHPVTEREVYLDLENSAPVPQEVVDEMLQFFTSEAYGNPTLTHKQGWAAYEEVMKAADAVRRFLGASSPEEVCFTTGEVEANNLAILGAVGEFTRLSTQGFCGRPARQGGKIVISAVEPVSVMFPAEMLEKKGLKVVKVPVDGEGFLDTDGLSEAVDEETRLVSVGLVNNEVGAIQPLREVVELVKDRNRDAIVHTDASDAYGRIRFDVKELGVDLATLSSYKILGPRGVGVLYVKEGTKIERVIEGPIGTQALWPGVENTPLIVGFKKASELAFTDFDSNVEHMRRLRDHLIDGLLSMEDAILNGPRGKGRAPDNANVSFLRCEGESLTIELSLKGVYVSSGSACTRKMLQPSHVLIALGREHEAAHGSILMKVSRYHSDEDVKYVVEAFGPALERLRAIGPTARG